MKTHIKKTTSKISGASTIKNNLKNIAQKPLKKTMKTHIKKPHKK
jgi:hypothetical protein